MTATERFLTEGERRLAASVFGTAIDYAPVRIHRRKWFPFQPRKVAMAPCGHIHFHPGGPLWSEDFAADLPWRQALFIHEMTHVWQAQTRGRLYLPLMRHPFCRYAYALKPGQVFERYGLEQQAEIVKHAFMLREGQAVRGAPPLEQYRSLLPFSFRSD
ncbi:MAG TPA: vgr related protein [Allosphingosinicella sp.]|nr:vgr related protein [Allosphingosinicella sp.]